MALVEPPGWQELWASRAVLALYLTAILSVAWVRRASVVSWFLHVDSPLNLALARIIVFAVILGTIDAGGAVAMSGLPRELLQPPLGMGWLMAWVPADPAAVRSLAWVLRVAAALAALGVLTRLSAAIAAVAACLFFAIPNLFGHVAHTHHHLVWFAGLLAVSRCADRLSLDAIWRDRARLRRGLPPLSPQPSSAYGFPLRSMLFLLGIAYFFAGFWKLWSSGFAWFAGDNLALLVAKLMWARGGDPLAVLARVSQIAPLGGLFVVAFELAFVVAIFFRRGRWLALAGGVVFHGAIRLFTGIAFTELLLCYPVFVDWAGWLARGRGIDAPRLGGGPAPSRLVIAVAAMLIVGNAAVGALRLGGAWPLSCFPRFDVVHKPRVTSYVITGRRADGETVEVRDADLGDPDLAPLHNVFRANQNRAPDLERADGREARWRILCTAVWRRHPHLHEAVQVEFALLDVDLSAGVDRARILDRRVLFACSPR